MLFTYSSFCLLRSGWYLTHRTTLIQKVLPNSIGRLFLTWLKIRFLPEVYSVRARIGTHNPRYKHLVCPLCQVFGGLWPSWLSAGPQMDTNACHMVMLMQICHAMQPPSLYKLVPSTSASKSEAFLTLPAARGAAH